MKKSPWQDFNYLLPLTGASSDFCSPPAFVGINRRRRRIFLFSFTRKQPCTRGRLLPTNIGIDWAPNSILLTAGVAQTSYGVKRSSCSKFFLLQNFMNNDGTTLFLFFFFFVPSTLCRASEASNIDCFKN